MKSKNANIVLVILIIVSLIISIWAYPKLPDTVASHWNAKGQVDGYMSQFWGAFLMPIVLVAMSIMFLVIPQIDPLKKNIDEFRKEYNGFILLIAVFLIYVHSITLLWNLGVQVNIGNMVMLGISVLFVYIGIVMRTFRRNFFIGIRTPWTLSNEVVWDKTHKFGGWLFIISGIMSLSAMFFGEIGLYIFLGCVTLASLGTVVYSYVIFKQENGNDLAL